MKRLQIGASFSQIPILCGLHIIAYIYKCSLNRDASVNHEATHPLP